MSCSAPSLSLPFFHPPPALQPDVVDVRATAPADAAETGVCCSRHCPQFRCLSLLSVRPLLTTWYVHLLLSVTLQRRRRLQGTDGSCIDARRWAPRCVLAMAPCTRRRARGDERANTAPPAPRALRHRRRRSRRSSRVRRAKTGSPQRSATTRKVAEALGTRLSTRADPFAREDITPLTSSPLVMSSPCSPPLTRIRPSKSTPTRPLTPQHPSPSDPPPRRRHAAPRRLFLDPISGRSTASKGECTSEMQRSQRAAGRRGIWVMPGDVLLASRRYPRRRRSQHTPPARPAVDIMATSRLRYRMCRVHREETARTHSPVYRMHDAQATTIAPTSTTITPTPASAQSTVASVSAVALRRRGTSDRHSKLRWEARARIRARDVSCDL